MFLICTGSGWFATYLPLPARLVTSITGNLTIGGTLGVTGKTTTAASATGGAGLNIPHGTDPTSPTNGDIWTTTSGIFSRINGATVQLNAGKRILQRAYKSTTTNDSTALTVPDDNTIPQNTECKLGLSAAAFTPTSATSKLCIHYGAMISNSTASTTGMLLLFKDSDAGALKTSPALAKAEHNQIVEYNVSFKPQNSRYLRIKVASQMTNPRWHNAPGQPSWLFIDEILVE